MSKCKACGREFASTNPHDEICYPCNNALKRLNGYAVPVVRCKDCKQSYDGVANLMCGRCGQNINGIRLGGVSVKAEHFCSYGERKNNEVAEKA